MAFTSSDLRTDPNDLSNNITCRHQETRCCVRLLNLLLGAGVLKAVIENYEVSGANYDVDIDLVGAYVNITFPKIFNTSHSVIDFFLGGGRYLFRTHKVVPYTQPVLFLLLVSLFSVVAVLFQLNVT